PVCRVALRSDFGPGSEQPVVATARRVAEEGPTSSVATLDQPWGGLREPALTALSYCDPGQAKVATFPKLYRSDVAMTVINRCAIGIGPRQPLIDWIRQVSGDPDVHWEANEDGLYLVPVYENDIEAISILENTYERIFKAELESWSRDPASWPSPRTFALFQEWFEIRFYYLVEDLGGEEFKQAVVDKAFEE
ncbi:MAG: hypothetical protein WAM11_00535, partial [Cyanobium sp.]